jgi:hypothetical protein
MRRLGPLVAVAILSAMGWMPRSEASDVARAVSCAKARKSLPVTSIKPAAESVEKASHRLYDDLGLPLVIVLEVPEVPPEIQEPSPSIQEQPRPLF